MTKKRIIAINLPQFHPFKENDEWWGKGFTEWTNVTKAKPRFHGHYQPHLPTDTGFYDLRLPEARQMQADMAREYGIYGFCYYHYWFNGKQLMERPIQEILASNEPDFPFMLCWANENWARNWAGGFKDILIQQDYSDEDDLAHMDYLCSKVFSDRRYIKIYNKPVFCIYRPNLFPNIKHTIETWRKFAKEKYNMELYLCFTDQLKIPREIYLESGFDAAIDFQPFCMGNFTKYHNLLNHITEKLFNGKLYTNYIYQYKEYVKYRLKTPLPSGKTYPCVCPNFDNSPRRVGKRFWAFKGSTPQLFGKWIADTIKRFKPFSPEENFIFINAWNEWAEGNHLEPDIKWGRGYLEELKKAIENNK